MPVLDLPLGPTLTAKQAAVIYARGKEPVVFALLKLAKQLGQSQSWQAQLDSPSTPSAMVPVHQKPAVKKRGEKLGRKAGHPGEPQGKDGVLIEQLQRGNRMLQEQQKERLDNNYKMNNEGVKAKLAF